MNKAVTRTVRVMALHAKVRQRVRDIFLFVQVFHVFVRVILLFPSGWEPFVAWSYPSEIS